jgi:hypothetical protein
VRGNAPTTSFPFEEEAHLATPEREYSLDHYLLECMKYSGIDPANLADLVAIAVSLKNKYGIMPFAASAQGSPVPNALTVRYIMEGITVNQIVSIVLEIPRLSALTIMPRGVPRAAQFEVVVTLGG